MGGKRKREEGRAASAGRTKPKVADMDQLDDHNVTTVVTTRTEGRPGNSGSKQPRMEGSVKVELDSVVEPGIAHNNQDQELLEEHSFSTPVLEDPDIDIGDDVKILQFPQDDDQFMLDEEDEGSINSKEGEISHSSKAEGRHPIASTSKASGKKVGTPERRNDTGAGATGGGKNSETNSKNSSDVNVISGLNKRVEKTVSNPADGTPLIIQNPQAAVPSQLLTNEQEQERSEEDQALSPSDTIAPVRNTPAMDASNVSYREALEDNSKLKLKVKDLQNEIKILHKEVTHLREGNDELTWFKNKYVKDSNWDSELHKAALEGTEKAVKKLVKDGVGAYVNSRNKELDTPLMYAAMRKDKTLGLKIIKYLIENGADPFAADDENRTFLHSLVSGGTTLTPNQFHDIVTFLISKNLAKLFSTPGWSSGEIPLQVAVKNIEVKEETLSALLGSGVDMKVVHQDGSNLLAYAIEGNRSSGLMIDLIFLGVDWKHLNKSKQSLLHTASEYCHVSGIKYFLTLGLDVNAVDDFGDTPLHTLILCGLGNVMGAAKVLLMNGANVEIKNADGRTPLDEAARQDNDLPDKEEVIRLLKGSEETSNVLAAPN